MSAKQTESQRIIELRLPDGSEVSIRPSANRLPIFKLDEVLKRVKPLDIRKAFSIDRRGISTIEDLVSILMGEMEALRMLACGLIDAQVQSYMMGKQLLEDFVTDKKDILDSEDTFRKMSGHAVATVASFDARLRALEGTLNIVQPARTADLPGKTPQARNYSQDFRMMLKIASNERRFPEISTAAAEKVFLAKEAETPRRPIIPSPTGEGTPLSLPLETQVEELQHEHNVTRKTMYDALRIAERDLHDMQEATIRHKRWADNRWRESDLTLSRSRYANQKATRLLPLLERAEATAQTLKDASLLPLFRIQDGPEPSSEPAVLLQTLTEALRSTASLANQSQSDLAEYTVAMTLECDKPVEELTMAELTQTLDWLPFEASFCLGDIVQAFGPASREDGTPRPTTSVTSGNQQSGDTDAPPHHSDSQQSFTHRADKNLQAKDARDDKGQDSAEIPASFTPTANRRAPVHPRSGIALTERVLRSRTRQKDTHRTEESSSTPATHLPRDAIASSSKKRGRQAAEEEQRLDAATKNESSVRDSSSARKKRKTR